LNRVSVFLRQRLADGPSLLDREAMPDDKCGRSLVGRMKQDGPKELVGCLQPSDQRVPFPYCIPSCAVIVKREGRQRLPPRSFRESVVAVSLALHHTHVVLTHYYSRRGLPPLHG